MNLRRLQAFRAVFESGSVTNVAQRLHMTQPAVSRLIRDLEKELGLVLFDRQQQRLIPSDEGRVFFFAKLSGHWPRLTRSSVSLATFVCCTVHIYASWRR